SGRWSSTPTTTTRAAAPPSSAVSSTGCGSSCERRPDGSRLARCACRRPPAPRGPAAGRRASRATIEAEVARLRELADGTAGSLRLWEPEVAAQESEEADGPLAQVLDELATAGGEAFALHGDGDRLTVIGADRGLLYGFYAVVLGQVPT